MPAEANPPEGEAEPQECFLMREMNAMNRANELSYGLNVKLNEKAPDYREQSLVFPYLMRFAVDHKSEIETFTAAREYRKTKLREYKEADKLYREAKAKLNEAFDDDSDEDPAIIATKRQKT